ncbi:MAG: hypothetical protein KJP12_07510 [Acidimicrobiia bacterium]|nr:hypothetical protein [Acidimicrobiia bacterium]NNF69100.1 hypothetical protein [Acidimicrobiia bacterium]
MSIDLAGFVTFFKDHALEHGFHIHGERHFLETYSLRQAWEIDLHPEEACDGPLDLNLTFDVEPRKLLAAEDAVETGSEEWDLDVPLLFNWALPPLATAPDLLVLATELAGIGGPSLPIEVSASDSYGAVSDGIVQKLSLTGRVEVSVPKVFTDPEALCDVFEHCRDVSRYLLDNADTWT